MADIYIRPSEDDVSRDLLQEVIDGCPCDAEEWIKQLLEEYDVKYD